MIYEIHAQHCDLHLFMLGWVQDLLLLGGSIYVAEIGDQKSINGPHNLCKGAQAAQNHYGQAYCLPSHFLSYNAGIELPPVREAFIRKQDLGLK